jgi:hypothetical protein
MSRFETQFPYCGFEPNKILTNLLSAYYAFKVCLFVQFEEFGL